MRIYTGTNGLCLYIKSTPNWSVNLPRYMSICGLLYRIYQKYHYECNKLNEKVNFEIFYPRLRKLQGIQTVWNDLLGIKHQRTLQQFKGLHNRYLNEQPRRKQNTDPIIKKHNGNHSRHFFILVMCQTYIPQTDHISPIRTNWSNVKWRPWFIRNNKYRSSCSV